MRFSSAAIEEQRFLRTHILIVYDDKRLKPWKCYISEEIGFGEKVEKHNAVFAYGDTPTTALETAFTRAKHQGFKVRNLMSAYMEAEQEIIESEDDEERDDNQL